MQNEDFEDLKSFLKFKEDLLELLLEDVVIKKQTYKHVYEFDKITNKRKIVGSEPNIKEIKLKSSDWVAASEKIDIAIKRLIERTVKIEELTKQLRRELKAYRSFKINDNINKSLPTWDRRTKPK